ncbi:uncharacterized protein LOC142349771 isoform X2 [Convolutriloba macropyga]|uniref:uncharacterized protein LOC142349771 isoform X2 n=1 Tax=Convolutriloba macropyga TaxID=536237 RepID=UPI003F527ED9
MTPVKKSNLNNLSQSVSMNLTSLTKHKFSEESRIKKNFRELRQLLDVREKWLLEQLDQLTNSQIAILRAQKSTIDEEASMCKENPLDNTYCLPLYKFSDVDMPAFLSNYERLRDCLLQFGEISTNGNSTHTETKSALDAIESEKWLQRTSDVADIDGSSDSWELDSSSTISRKEPLDQHLSHQVTSFVKDDLDDWLLSTVKAKSEEESVSELVRAWTLREKASSPIAESGTSRNKSSASSIAGSITSDYHWIKREACRLNCPENNKQNNVSTGAQYAGFYPSSYSAPVVEIEDLTQLKCVSMDEHVSPQIKTTTLSNCEMKQWLAPSAKKPITIVTSPSVHSESMTSRCSSVSNFCEANELCSGFDECLADEPRCLNRYNEWLMTSAKRPAPPKPRLQAEDLSLWLEKRTLRSQESSNDNDVCPVLGCMTKDIDTSVFLPKSCSSGKIVSSNDKMEWFDNGFHNSVDFWLAK